MIGERVGNLHGHGVRFLAGGAAGAPEAQGEILALLLAAKNVVENVFVEQIQLRLVAEEAGLVHREIFQQLA